MSMGGFFWGHSHCIMFLFSSLPLTSPLRFALGVLGTIAMGIGIEALTWVRRVPFGASRSELARRQPWLWSMLSVTLFAVQTALAYALMLIAMTYQGELFLAVVGGLRG